MNDSIKDTGIYCSCISYIKTEHDFSEAMFSAHPQQNVTKQLIKIVNGLAWFKKK